MGRWKTAYVRRLLGALLDISAGGVGELGIPGQVLGAVETTPVPVSAHHSTNEVGVVLVRSRVVLKSSGLDVVSRCSDCRGSCEGDN
jgi:hypothetical protein